MARNDRSVQSADAFQSLETGLQVAVVTRRTGVGLHHDGLGTHGVTAQQHHVDAGQDFGIAIEDDQPVGIPFQVGMHNVHKSVGREPRMGRMYRTAD